jgi:hypothetical protein
MSAANRSKFVYVTFIRTTPEVPPSPESLPGQLPIVRRPRSARRRRLAPRPTVC